MVRTTIGLLLLAATALTGCATLTKSQVRAVNDFATLTEKGAGYPDKLLNETIDNLYQARVLDGSQNVSSTRPLTVSVIAAYNVDRLRGLDTVRLFKVQLRALKEYAEALQRLSSPDFATKAASAADALGKSVDKAAATVFTNPVTGIGKALSGTLKAVGNRYIGAKQTKAIQRYVNTGDTLIAAICTRNERFFQTNVNGYIAAIERTQTATANGMLQTLSGQPAASVERFQLASEMADRIARYEQLRQLNQQTIQAFRQIRLAHHELRNTLQTKQTLQSVGQQLVDFYDTINELQETYQSIKR